MDLLKSVNPVRVILTSQAQVPSFYSESEQPERNRVNGLIFSLNQTKFDDSICMICNKNNK